MIAVLRRVIGGLRALVRARHVDDELDEEVRAYLEASIEAKVGAGMTRADAVRACRVEHGSIDAVNEYTRDVGWETRLEGAWRDARYAARTLRKAPAFTAAAVATLALGIGANTAIFSAVNAIMLRQLPVERPHELISLAAAHANGVEPVFSYAAYRRLADDGAHLVETIAASTVRRDAITIDGPPEPVDHQWVSGNYFHTLGVAAAAGRTLVHSDDQHPPGEAVAVLSDAYWARRFGRDPAAIGRTFRLKTTTFTIVGVAPPGFLGESAGERVELWMPLTSVPGAPSWLWAGHSTTWLRLIGRRRADVSIDQARAGLAPVYERVRDETASGSDSAEYRSSVLASRLLVSDASRGASRLRDNLSVPLLILMAIVALVLLVACANLANLMLARAAARRTEIALCLAIGAGRPRLVCEGLTEALLLAVFGGLGGVILAQWGSSALEAMVSGALPVALDVSPDGRVLAFAAITTCATVLAFGALPALRATRIDPVDTLKASNVAAGGPRRTRLPRALVGGQIAVSVVLLVLAGLFVRSLIGLQRIDTGFDPADVILLRVALPARGELTPDLKRSLYRHLLERAENVPGVLGASASFTGVMSSETWRNVIAVEGFAPPAGVTPRSFANAVTAGYFSVMRIAVLRGRGFTDADREATGRIAVVSDTFARQFFAARNPVGKRVQLCSSEPCGAPDAMMTIVGVVEDAKYTDLREPPRPMLYVPFTQTTQNLSELQVRTSGDPAAVAATLHRELAAADPRLTIVGMIEARDRVDASLIGERLIAQLSATFGLLAAALAAVGLYGLVAYVTVQRTGEIGIRVALGATRSDVRRLVVRDAVTLLAAGLLIGVPIAIAGARLIASQLYEVTPTDALVFGSALATISGAALIAGYLPARRAVRLDPATALRRE